MSALWCIFKMHHKKQCWFRIPCDKSATSLLESGEECHIIKVINNNNNQEERMVGNQKGPDWREQQRPCIMCTLSQVYLLWSEQHRTESRTQFISNSDRCIHCIQFHRHACPSYDQSHHQPIAVTNRHVISVDWNHCSAAATSIFTII